MDVVLFQRGVRLLVVLAAWTASAAPGGPGEKPPVTESGEGHIASLIEQLGNPDYYARQKAQDDLARIGFEAFDALSAASTHRDLEIAARARYLLRLMQVEWTREGDLPQVRTLLENYGWLQPEDRQERIEKLARLPDAAGTAALCRIVRFEQSSDMSKRAAVELLAVYAMREPALPEVAETILQSLHDSRRPGARWLLAWASNYQDPEALVAHFAKFIEEEQASAVRPGISVDTDVLAALLRFQVAWLEQLGRREQAIAAMRHLISLEKGDIEDLRKLLIWLIDQKAWPLVDELAERFEGQVRNTPALLYLLAEAQAEQGSEEQAEATAQRALALRQGNNRNWLNERRLLATELWKRHRPDWAAREFRYVLDNGPKTDLVTILARHDFTRMLHDRGEALAAAEILQALVEHFKDHPDLAGQLGTSAEMTRARMHYFFACHYHQLKDYAKQREHLDKALADDPDELDALIARYHLPDQSEEYHRETLGMIRASADALRENIANQPDEPIWYNQFAWLIGNTEGDLDEALRYSHKSLELSPDEAAYLDTLAHVYFAKKDYANAVKYQSWAVGLESYSKLITDKLEVFRAAMDSQP